MKQKQYFNKFKVGPYSICYTKKYGSCIQLGSMHYWMDVCIKSEYDLFVDENNVPLKLFRSTSTDINILNKILEG